MILPHGQIVSQSLFLRDGSTSASNRLFSTESTCDDIHDCRTLSSIILGCLTTLGACTWVSVHPNIPDWDDGIVALNLRRLRLMILALIAPEVIVLWALRQWMVARHLSKAHTLTMVQGFFVSMGGFVMPKEHGLARVASHAIGYALAEEIRETHEHDIADRSKSDQLSKGIALVQTAWFITQCIARKVQGLPLAELEVVTAAFASFKVVIYLMYTVETDRSMWVAGSSAQLESRGSPLTWRETILSTINVLINDVIQIFSGEPYDGDLPPAANRVPELWAGKLDAKDRAVAAGVAIFLAIAFGAIHCAAWNVGFPSAPERIMWRVASVSSMAIPAFFLVKTVVLFRNYSITPEWYKDVTFYFIIPFGVLAYIIGRGMLMALPLASLRSLPADVYTDIDWTKFIPHIS